MDEHKVVSDKTSRSGAQALRGLAHPLRVQLLGHLRSYGPSTATRLAAAMGLTSGATSYHLRQLATYGFVEEAPAANEREAGRGVGRERWWRAVHQATGLTAQDLAPESADATVAYLRAAVALHIDQMQRAVDEWPGLSDDRRQATTFSDFRLRLTAEEQARLRAEAFALFSRYRADEPDDTAAPTDSEPVVVQFQIFPRPQNAGSGSV